ncbi:MAG TPA: PIN domain-containing protein [Gemmatimonadaceae bacterium]|nr:PIN domain-containing protein [Gemmatimonadaceae bacterium]
MARRSVRERPPGGRGPTGGAPGSEREGSADRPILLVDTNVVLDVLLARAPWDAEGALLLDAIARGRAMGYVAARTVTTIHYIVERAKNRTAAVTVVGDLLLLLDVVPLDAADFQRALALGLRDYEDAVQVAACLRVGADFLVTRNPRDFKGAPVATRSAGEVLALLTSSAAE